MPGGYSYDPDASTAKTLVLVAIILQVIFFIIGIFVASFFFLAIPFFTTGGGPFAFSGFGILSVIFAFGFLLSIVWILLDYFLVYRNLETPSNIPNARTPALILGIIQLVSGGVISGILLLVAYVKIGDSLRRRGQPY